MLCPNYGLFLRPDLVLHALCLFQEVAVALSELLKFAIGHDLHVVNPHIFRLEVNYLGLE